MMFKIRKKPGRKKGSKNKPKEEVVTTENKKELPPKLQELMAKKIDFVTDKLVDELNKQNMLVDSDLSFKYLMKLVKLVDCNPNLEIDITTRDGSKILIRNKPEDYAVQNYESLLETLPEENERIKIS